MSQEVLEKLKQAVYDCDRDAAADLARKALDERIEPLSVMDALIEAIRKVGDEFGQGTLFLPDLVGAAAALQDATTITEAAIAESGQKRKAIGTVVIGTVAGDIHTIGKSMVASLLTADGFEVYDIGIDVPAEKFVAAVQEHNADILGMSALLTTTAPQCQVVIQQLAEMGIRDRVKVIVGGGAITEPFAKTMGADGYKPTAPGAVTLARELLKL